MVTWLVRLVGGVVVIGCTWLAARHTSRVEKNESASLANEADTLMDIRLLAETVFGNCVDADEWLNEPAIALDGHRPLDLLTTQAGAVLVKDLLIRLDHCVFV